MHHLSSTSNCPLCKRAEGDILIPDIHAAGAIILVTALVHGNDNPQRWRFTTTGDGEPGFTATDETNAILDKHGLDPVPVIPLRRILDLLSVAGMQLNTHYIHLDEFAMVKAMASEFFNILQPED